MRPLHSRSINIRAAGRAVSGASGFSAARRAGHGAHTGAGHAGPRRSRAGVTLVELVVSMAIVAVVLAMAAALFLTSRQSLNRSVRISKDSDAITAYLDGGGTLPEGFSAESGGGGTLVLDFGGEELRISGRYETVTSADGQVTYRVFVHD